MAAKAISNAKIRDARQAQGLTLEELGEKVGKSKQYLSELERGHIRLTYDLAVEIAAALGTTPDSIFLAAKSEPLVLGNGVAAGDGDAA